MYNYDFVRHNYNALTWTRDVNEKHLVRISCFTVCQSHWIVGCKSCRTSHKLYAPFINSMIRFYHFALPLNWKTFFREVHQNDDDCQQHLNQLKWKWFKWEWNYSLLYYGRSHCRTITNNVFSPRIKLRTLFIHHENEENLNSDRSNHHWWMRNIATLALRIRRILPLERKPQGALHFFALPLLHSLLFSIWNFKDWRGVCMQRCNVYLRCSRIQF